MATRAKRTYNLSEMTVRRVREIAEQYGGFRTQDRVVDAAVERLYLELRTKAEEAQWAAAADDPEFQAEAAAIAEVFGDRDSWPA
jgi:phosphoglycolate phosphatase-like HAD superfamily hydrolase